jgi:hypothetical protein
MMELLKSVPAPIPLVKTPGSLHKHAAQALVAHAINGAKSARASAGVFARRAPDKAADLVAVVEAVPVEDLGAHLGASPIADPRKADSSMRVAGFLIVFSSSWSRKSQPPRPILLSGVVILEILSTSGFPPRCSS